MQQGLLLVYVCKETEFMVEKQEGQLNWTKVLDPKPGSIIS